MAHPQQYDFCRRLAARFPLHFSMPRALAIGALDINSTSRGINERQLFAPETEVIGIDPCPGPGVDVVCRAHEYVASDEAFDVVYACEVAEHDVVWHRTFAAMIRLTRPGGLVFFTCATIGRPEHGTRRRHPRDAPLAGDYYENRTIADYIRGFDLDSLFVTYGFEVEHMHHDLYYWGMRR